MFSTSSLMINYFFITDVRTLDGNILSGIDDSTLGIDDSTSGISIPTVSDVELQMVVFLLSLITSSDGSICYGIDGSVSIVTDVRTLDGNSSSSIDDSPLGGSILIVTDVELQIVVFLMVLMSSDSSISYGTDGNASIVTDVRNLDGNSSSSIDDSPLGGSILIVTDVELQIVVFLMVLMVTLQLLLIAPDSSISYGTDGNVSIVTDVRTLDGNSSSSIDNSPLGGSILIVTDVKLQMVAFVMVLMVEFQLLLMLEL
ncbi:hypothetical protein CEXT_625021 [Caerostris extrusa]|uniref:Uncharacterized protein n=1 Tax=Caerostris extrusa TaxID=172846 RepID=A0AAV4RX78_CAEEX|nr:hypothetical protein CEXT_625021 [Caerostris extrusa]